MEEQPLPGQPLGLTARWTAGARAKENLRENHLFHDPWAATLAGKEGEEWVEHRSGDNGNAIALRTRFFDDFLLHATSHPTVHQVVLMASGLDTRAFRLIWPAQTRLFELDHPQVLKEKEQVLTAAQAQPTCERHTIAADLTAPWREPLLQAGFDPLHPSVWLLEGFLFYLPQETITRLLDEITNLATPGSWLGFDIINKAMLTSAWTRQWVESLSRAGTPWIGTMDDPEADLSARGWQTTLTQPGEGYLELLRVMEDASSDLRRSFLDKACRACDELVLLQANIMDTSRLGVDAATLHFTSIALRDLCTAVIDLFEPWQQQRTIEIDVAPDMLVWADELRLKQVLHYLLANALRYSPPHTPIRVAATAEQEAGMARVRVSDRGLGIPADKQEAIFEKFVRLDRDLYSTVRGSGLGLFITRQLVEAMGGTIKVESSGIAGDGSTFSFTLPLAQRAA